VLYKQGALKGHCSVKIFLVTYIKIHRMQIAAKKKKSLPKGAALFMKILEDKKTISKHLKNGGTIEELKKKGYRFATL
jgi:CTP-dependent riboflavin kinase